MNFEAVATTENDTIQPEPRIWRSCCIESDREAVVYLTTFSLIFTTLGFCFHQLIVLHECNSQQAYLSILTLILGIVIPSPVIKKKK